ncbi:hypothetical protein Tco_1012779 [Tanacetum coccineum]
MSMTIQSSLKDKILATSSKTSKAKNTPTEMLRDLDQQMEKRADDGKANVVTDALSRKERVKPGRVRAMAMITQYGVRGMILAAQSEAFKNRGSNAQKGFMGESCICSKTFGLLQQPEDYLSENEIEYLNFITKFPRCELARIYIVDEDNNKRNENSTVTGLIKLRWMIYLVVLADAAKSVRDTIGFEYCLASSSGWTKSPVLWAEIGESSLTSLSYYRL